MGERCKLEILTKEALKSANIKFIEDGTRGLHGKTRNLDFYLPEHDVYIEVCAYHTPRKIEQSSRAENVIILQGYKSVLLFTKYLERTKE